MYRARLWIDRRWPPLDSEWSQLELHIWCHHMGIIPDPNEIVPQGVKFIMWPQPPVSEADIRAAQRLEAMFKEGRRKPIAVIRRRRDPKNN